MHVSVHWCALVHSSQQAAEATCLLPLLWELVVDTWVDGGSRSGSVARAAGFCSLRTEPSASRFGCGTGGVVAVTLGSWRMRHKNV